MAPKYRGDSDDWLDSESTSQSKKGSIRVKKANSARSLDLPLDQSNAVVAEVFPNQCRVKLDLGEVDLLCSYRRAEVVGKAKRDHRERTPVAVGDRVLVQQSSPTTGVVEGICARKNRLSRPAPGRESGEFHHVLAANIDLLVIAASTQEPEFSSGLIDRFLIAAEMEKIPIIICITKIDLMTVQAAKPWKIYTDLGYEVVEVSTKQEGKLSALPHFIEGKTTVFCGQSGVGKTSLLRALLKSEVGRVGKVNEITGKGRHTTTGAVLLPGPFSSKWIDTPGVKEFGLLNLLPEDLASLFPEFKDLQCSSRYCRHIEEGNCNARELARYPSYRRIYDSLSAKKY